MYEKVGRYLRKRRILAGLVTETKAIRLTPIHLAKEVSKSSIVPCTLKRRECTNAASPPKVEFVTTAFGTTSNPQLVSPDDNNGRKIANNPSARVDPVNGLNSSETSKGKIGNPSDCLTIKSAAIEFTGRFAR